MCETAVWVMQQELRNKLAKEDIEGIGESFYLIHSSHSLVCQVKWNVRQCFESQLHSINFSNRSYTLPLHKKHPVYPHNWSAVCT